MLSLFWSDKSSGGFGLLGAGSRLTFDLGLRANFTLRREKWEYIRRCWRDLELNYSHFAGRYPTELAI